jgi:hypothetical protein
MVAWPNPFHTGVVGLKLCVRSTNSLPWMVRSASARVGEGWSAAEALEAARPGPSASKRMATERRLIIVFIGRKRII